jgi:hypothetical protein
MRGTPRITVIEEGQLKGSFRGFRNRDTIFEFRGGCKWRQKVYKYHYHYAYMPQARVVEGPSGPEIQIDGMSDTVAVVRIS